MDMNPTLLLLLKVTVVLGCAFAAARWHRTAPALRRHGVWSATFVALAALPLLAVLLPEIRIPVPTRPQPVRASSSTRVMNATPASPEPAIGTSATINAPFTLGVVSTNPGKPVPVTGILLAVWLIGLAAALAILGRSLLRVRTVVSTGRPVDDPEWTAAANRIARILGLRTPPRLVTSHAVLVPMAGAVGGPIVLLPADAGAWNDERRDVVLMHEMTHLVHRDPLRILGARIACALYWFHPLMWLAARRSAADCEQACDESVLARGVRPSTYARILLDFANTSPTPLLSVALPIVHRHRLEARVMAILSSVVPKHLPTKTPRSLSLTTLATATLILAVAAAQPASTADASPVNVTTLPPTIVTPVPLPATAAVTPPASVSGSLPGSEFVLQRGSCWAESASYRSFSGSARMENSVVIQRIGRIGRERVAQMTFGDLRVCVITDGYSGPENAPPGDWIGRADRVVLETERDRDVRRLEISDSRTLFTINGRSAPMDDDTRAWRGALLDVLDATWEVSVLRGRESSLRGEISSIEGERSSLRGEISSLRGHVSSLMGEISSIRGEESSLRGEISSIRGHESSLRGEISSERGAISSLEALRWERGSDRETVAARIRRHEDAIRDIEQQILRYDAPGRVREVERRIEAFDADRRVAEVERLLREFDVEAKVAAVERQISGLGVDRQRREIEGEIEALDVNTRARVIERRRDDALARLRATLAR